MGISSGISTKWLFIHCFQIELEFRSVDFCGVMVTFIQKWVILLNSFARRLGYLGYEGDMVVDYQKNKKT